MDDETMTSRGRLRDITAYGFCEVCGMARTVLVTEDGSGDLWSLVCTVDPTHSN